MSGGVLVDWIGAEQPRIRQAVSEWMEDKFVGSVVRSYRGTWGLLRSVPAAGWW